jgi:hypothetical protein
MAESAKNHPDLAAALDQIHQGLAPYYQELGSWGAAARWAQLYTRITKEKSSD